MANYALIKSDINTYITTNGNQEITGAILNGILRDMIDVLGSGFRFAGIATPDGTPVVGDNNVFFLAPEAGTYTNYGGLVVSAGEVAALTYNGSWSKLVTGLTTSAEMAAVMADLANKANIDGYYEQMAVGLAKNIEGISPVTGSFLERPTGGDAEVANGSAQVTEVAGKSQQWNQLVADRLSNWTASGFTITTESNAVKFTKVDDATTCIFRHTSQSMPIVSGHKYLLRLDCSASASDTLAAISVFDASFNTYLAQNAIDITKGCSVIVIASRTGVADRIAYTCTIANGTIVTVYGDNIIDLTLLGIDNLTTVAEVEAWLAKNVGLKAYYPFNPGEVLNNKMEGLESTNRNLLDATTGLARIIGAYSDVYGNYYGITGTHGALTFTSDLGETSTITPDSDGKFLLEEPGWLDVATPGEDCAVFLWWDGTKTDYVEHKVSKAYVDVTHIWGKKNGTGDLVQIWPSGMPGLPSVKDILRNEDGVAVARRRFGVVDLGTLNYVYNNGTFRVTIQGKALGVPNKIDMLCSKYIVFGGGYSTSNHEKGCWSDIGYTLIYFQDSGAGTDASAFKTAMSGVMLIYELATEEVYTDLVYQGSSHFADGTPVTLPVSLEADNWGIERVIPQNDESIVTSAPEVSILYAVNAAEELDTIRTSGIFVEDLKANINALLAVVNEKLETAMGGTISLGSTPVDKVYPVIFTPTPEPEPGNENEG